MFNKCLPKLKEYLPQHRGLDVEGVITATNTGIKCIENIDNPNEFNPDRFKNVNVDKELKWIYMPFSEGPRKCIGNNFAMLEMIIITTMLSKEFKIQIENMENIKMHNGITSRPKEDIYVRIEKNCS